MTTKVLVQCVTLTYLGSMFKGGKVYTSMNVVDHFYGLTTHTSVGYNVLNKQKSYRIIHKYFLNIIEIYYTSHF